MPSAADALANRIDRTPTRFTESAGCCGMGAIYDLKHDPKDIIAKLWHRSDCFALWVFSDAVKFGNGVALAKTISKHRLGRVVGSAQKTNRNSGNMIKAWVWAPNYNAVERFVRNYEKGL